MKQKFCNEKFEKRGNTINRFQSGTSYNGEFERKDRALFFRAI